MASQSRPLSEQFADLDRFVQGGLFSVLDVLIGMGTDDKPVTRRELALVGDCDLFSQPTQDLLRAVRHLVD